MWSGNRIQSRFIDHCVCAPYEVRCGHPSEYAAQCHQSMQSIASHLAYLYNAFMPQAHFTIESIHDYPRFLSTRQPKTLSIHHSSSNKALLGINILCAPSNEMQPNALTEICTEQYNYPLNYPDLWIQHDNSITHLIHSDYR